MTITEATVERDVLAWFHSSWDPDLSLLQWRALLVDAGWAVPSWAEEWFGKGLPAWADRVAHQAIRGATISGAHQTVTKVRQNFLKIRDGICQPPRLTL